MDIKTAFTNFIRTHSSAQHMLGWNNLFAPAKFLMREKKAKNIVKVGEFSEFLKEPGAIDGIRRCFRCCN